MTTPRIAAEKAEKAQPDTRKCLISPRHHRAVKLTVRRCDFNTMFKIVVGAGPKQKNFTVYNDVIIPRSELFRAARSATWIKDEPTRLTSLEHEDPKTFAAYLHAVTYDRIHFEGFQVDENGGFEDNAAFEEDVAKSFGDPSPQLVHPRKSHERFRRLISLYIISTMLLDHETANIIVDDMIRTHDLVHWVIPSFNNVRLLYSSTVAGDCMRNLICDYHVGFEYETRFANLDWPVDFLKDLALNFMRHKADGISKS